MRTSRRIRSPLPAELPPQRVTAVIDTREQLPLDLTPLRTIVSTLPTGDYSISGLEDVVAVERKSLGDLLSCVGRERERFDREVQRLLAYPARAPVVEATWPEIERGDWRGNITPRQALGSVLGWMASGLPVAMVGDHTRAGRYVWQLLFTAARRRWREARALIRGVAEQNAIAMHLESGRTTGHDAPEDAA